MPSKSTSKLEEQFFMEYVENCGISNLNDDELRRWDELRKKNQNNWLWQYLLIGATSLATAVLSTMISLWMIWSK